jgi:hypothetical protein
MRSYGKPLASLKAAAMLAALGAGVDIAGSLRYADRAGYTPTPPKRDTALAREIAEWNAAVDRRKAEKRGQR